MYDREVTALFEARGWTVLRIWECELKKKNEKALLERLRIALKDKQLSEDKLIAVWESLIRRIKVCPVLL